MTSTEHCQIIAGFMLYKNPLRWDASKLNGRMLVCAERKLSKLGMESEYKAKLMELQMKHEAALDRYMQIEGLAETIRRVKARGELKEITTRTEGAGR